MRQFPVFSSGAIGVAIVAVVLSACAGSSTVAVPSAQSTSSASASATVVTSTTASVSVSATSANGTIVTVELPPANAAVAVTETLTSTAPTGYAVSRAVHGGLFAERSALAGTPDALLYIVLTSSANVTLTGPPSVTIIDPTIAPGDSYYLAGLSSTGTTTFSEGPGTVSGTTISFGALLAVPNIQITPTDPLVIEFYAVSPSGPSASPTGSALPAASPSPSPEPVVATPTSLTFASTASAPQSFSVTQTNNTGSFNVATTPSGIVSIGETSPGTYTVTPVGVGTATITISGNGSESTTVTATVQTVPITVSSTTRNEEQPQR